MSIRSSLLFGISLLAAQALASPASAASRATDAKLSPADVNAESLRRAIEHLSQSYGDLYPRGKEFLNRLSELETSPSREALEALRREALLANPLLDFDKLLMVRRAVGGGTRDARGKVIGAKPLGLPQNWQGNCALPNRGFDNEIAVLSPVRPGGKVTTLYKPEKPAFVGDVDLHFDGRKMLFSSIGAGGRWQIFEIGVDGEGLRQVTRGDQPDVDNYDACYLPSEKIVFGSTACMQGVPCVGGGNQVANLYLMDPDGSHVRQLCFDQDHNWCPTVMNDGRVMFSRWEYSDTPHYFTRLLFHMNPDGSAQTAAYGSNSYWPNSIFYARPVPDHPTRVIAVISGHHGVPRMGELVLFDTARGQFEADGAVQRIPGYGKKVKSVIVDGLANGSWPKFLHPYPLSSEYFLVSAMPSGQSSWGIYLIDVFDNMLLLAEEPGVALLEPIPLRKTPRPPVIPDKIQPEKQDAVVYLNDVYRGPGLTGVPRGTIKSLRVFAFHYGYQHLASHTYVGIDGPWDIHRIVGTVPVERDGSALFKVPADTPIAVQPLDAEGRALQIMRSWYTAMPGETISCVGCHERQTDLPRVIATQAAARKPSELRPWFGPARGFSFKRDVQPVVDHYCVECHNGRPQPDGTVAAPDLSPGKVGSFTRAYTALHPYVRRPGPESDYHLMPTAEYCANTSEFIQMLKKGHHGVTLDPEAWERLYTWIDLNVPDHGTWGEFRTVPGKQHERRCELRKLYTGADDDPEAVPDLPTPAFANSPKPAQDATRGERAAIPQLAGWPLSADEAKKRQAAAGIAVERTITLGEIKLPMVLIPAGEFVMGSNSGDADEGPAHVVKIEKPFWIGKCEITNEQYRLFDPSHDSRYISVFGKDQSSRGIPVNGPQQPVVRVPWTAAAAFCRWLAQETGERFSLPTEAQWEYACRAGTATPMNYGAVDADYSKLANLADETLNLRANWHVKDKFARDGANVSADVGRYAPNAWGLCDVHGNAAEWTASIYKPYPYRAGDGREPSAEQITALADKPGEEWPSMVVRGGSWYDRAKRATSSFRLAYPAWQGVYNVGFRVVVPVDGPR
ncbi:MAG: SUMF1/EgtB/PvdO family nonheme iron enzyme [Thermoguttaceae bacterium]|jgi:formylglycine-generating enzyme required for sulfatase activity